VVDIAVTGRQLTAVIFDYDGVLVNSMPTHVAAWQEAFHRCANLEISAAELFSREGEAREQMVADLFRLVVGRKPEKGQISKIIAWRDCYYRSHTTRLFPHVRDLLASFQSQSVMLAVVSGNVDVHRELRSRQIDHFFRVVISPADSIYAKPHPAPYLAAVKRLRIPRSRCVVVENSPLGIKAARQASIFCVAIKANSPLTVAELRRFGASAVFRSIADFHTSVEGHCRHGIGISDLLDSDDRATCVTT
jgi:beta-phosphoglucomutase